MYAYTYICIHIYKFIHTYIYIIFVCLNRKMSNQNLFKFIQKEHFLYKTSYILVCSNSRLIEKDILPKRFYQKMCIQ